MNRIRRQPGRFTCLAIIFALLGTGLVNSTHVHLNHPQGDSSDVVAHHGCSCTPQPEHSPDGEPVPSDDGSEHCPLCKLIDQFQADVFSAPVEFSTSHSYELCVATSTPSIHEPFRVYCGRAPPAA